MQRFKKIQVENISIDALDDDSNFFSDEDKQTENFISEDKSTWLVKLLTKRQREIVELLKQGYNRQEIAKKLNPPVCVQAVHQIILRIRKRMEVRGGIKVKGNKRHENTDHRYA